MLCEFVTITAMRILYATALGLALSLTAQAQKPANSPAQKPPASNTSCQVGDPQCLPGAKAPSKHDLKTARHDYNRARKLMKQGKLIEAADLLDQALALAPRVPEYVHAAEMVRQQRVAFHIDRGNKFMQTGQTVAAMGEFQQALDLDPSNQYARQRLEDTLPTRPSARPAPLSPDLSVVAESKPVVLNPNSAIKELHFKGSARSVLEQVASAFGMKLLFDESVSSKQIRFDMDNADFFTAFREANVLAHTFWVPLTPKQVILFNDTQQLRREYERTISATFYLTNATSAQELTEVVNMVRTLFDVRFVVPQPSNNSVVMRAPAPIVEAASKVLENLLGRKPQVTLNVQVYTVSQSLMQALGLSIPTQFQVINVGAAALALLGQGNVQNLINQLISSGGINAANSQGLQALLSQLQNQQSNSILQTLSQTPFATFGGGKTLFAVPIPPLTATAQLNRSDLQTLQTVMLRTQQNTAATLKIGERYPILNASFAPIYNTPAIAQVIGNGSYQAPFPSVSYEDLGLSLKATPQVLSDGSINLKVEMSIKALAGQSYNGVPVLSNREYTASLSVLDGATTAVTGFITQSEQRSLSGLPGFSALPGIGALTSTRNKDLEYQEILIVITPTIISPARQANEQTEVWLPAS